LSTFTKAKTQPLYFLKPRGGHMDNSLSEEVSRFRTYGEGSENILLRFKPLLLRYAVKMGYPDSLSDLSHFLLTTFYRLNPASLKEFNDAVLIKYAQKSLVRYCNDYLRQQRKRQNELEYEETLIDQFNQSDDIGSSLVESLALKDALNKLDEEQREIISLYYFNETRTIDIAFSKGTSRQAVNQCRLRALDTLRTLLKD